MSKYSGKCDFYDGFCMIHSDGDEEKIKENLKKLNLYITSKDGRIHQVKCDTIKDIVPYYPYLESIATYDKEDGCNIFLSSEPFIDQEEKEHRDFYVKEVLKYWRKCRRNKKEFVPEECCKELSWCSSKKQLMEIIERIGEDGARAKFDDIHFPMWERYRREWYEAMIEAGYGKIQAYIWCFNESFICDKETMKRRLGEWNE